MEFTQITQKRGRGDRQPAREAGRLRAEQAQGAARRAGRSQSQELERLAKQIRDEVRSQVQNLGLATQADVVRLERRLAKLEKGSKPAKKTAKKSTKKSS